MKKVEFRLTMPSNNSWNGRWSGEGRNYLIYKSLTDKQALLLKLIEGKGENSWWYDFGDGWTAKVSARAMNGERKQKSNGFCGYDWMVDSILSYGKIMSSRQLTEQKV